MGDDQYQDVITFSQPLLKEITDENIIELFKDDNYSSVIECLRTHKGAMTVPELQKSTGKSDKTIYRYLNKLEETGLVTQAGKRVFLSKKKAKTQSLYMRSAKVFYIVKPEEEEASPEEKNMIEAIGISIGKNMKAKIKSVDCLEKFLKRFKDHYSSYPIGIIQNAEEEITGLLEDLDFEYSKSFIEMISLLALLNDRIEWQKELLKCFE